MGSHSRAAASASRLLILVSIVYRFLNHLICANDRLAKEGRGGGFDSGRDLSNASWERKGPLAALPGSDRPGRSEYSERRAPREPMADDGKVRDFGNWERRGPLSPSVQPERIGGRSRDGSRPGTNDGRSESFRNRRASPGWGPGEGRGEAREPRLDGSRPPRREFSDRPERAPTAAETDSAWRSHMRPDAPIKSESHSRAGSEAPSSPAGGAHATLAPGGRPKLNLIKRTVSEQPAAATSPAASSATDSKASPFGAARPIDTAAREREIEEKHIRAIQEKKEADEKAKEDKRLAKEAAAKEAADKAAADEAAKEAAAEAAKNAPEEPAKEVPEEAAKDAPDAAEVKPDEAKETATEAAPASASSPAENGEQKVPVRTREPREPREPREARGPREPREPRGDAFANAQTRATESGNWRSATAERGGARGGGAPRGARGGGVPRGPRNDGGRPPRANGAAPATSVEGAAGEPETPKTDADGWTTVTLPTKGRRGGGRPIVS